MISQRQFNIVPMLDQNYKLNSEKPLLRNVDIMYQF